MAGTSEQTGFTKSELRVLNTLSTPQRIQDFLDTNLRYNTESRGETCKSPRHVLRTRTAHCIEGAMLAAAALRMHGMKPLIVDLAAKRDYDHVICVFRQQGKWGAISMSRYHTLGWRDPVFNSLRELALSYFVFYNNQQGTKTLHSYSNPVDLSRFDKNGWMTSDDNQWDIANYLFMVKHHQIISDEHRKHLRPLSKRFVQADTMRR